MPFILCSISFTGFLHLLWCSDQRRNHFSGKRGIFQYWIIGSHAFRVPIECSRRKNIQSVWCKYWVTSDCHIPMCANFHMHLDLQGQDGERTWKTLNGGQIVHPFLHIVLADRRISAEKKTEYIERMIWASGQEGGVSKVRAKIVWSPARNRLKWTYPRWFWSIFSDLRIVFRNDMSLLWHNFDPESK